MLIRLPYIVRASSWYCMCRLVSDKSINEALALFILGMPPIGDRHCLPMKSLKSLLEWSNAVPF